MLFLLIIRFVQHNDKLCTVTEFNLCLSLLADLHRSSLFRISIKRIIHFFSKKCIIGTFQNLYQSLSAGVDNTCLFQHRKHLRSLCQYFFGLFDDKSAELFHIFYRRCQICGLVSRTFGNCQNRTFLRLHNCLVCSLYCFVHGICQVNHIQFLMVSDSLGKTSEKLRKNNTRVSSCPTQRTRRDAFCQCLHIHVCQR